MKFFKFSEINEGDVITLKTRNSEYAFITKSLGYVSNGPDSKVLFSLLGTLQGGIFKTAVEGALIGTDSDGHWGIAEGIPIRFCLNKPQNGNDMFTSSKILEIVIKKAE